MPFTAQHGQAFMLACLCLVLVGCPIGDQTIFYQVRGSVFSAQNVPANHVMVSAITLSWHPRVRLGGVCSPFRLSDENNLESRRNATRLSRGINFSDSQDSTWF